MTSYDIPMAKEPADQAIRNENTVQPDQFIVERYERVIRGQKAFAYRIYPAGTKIPNSMELFMYILPGKSTRALVGVLNESGLRVNHSVEIKNINGQPVIVEPPELTRLLALEAQSPVSAQPAST